MLLGFPGLGFANEPAPRDWQPVRGPAPATSLDLWEGKGLLARSLDGGLWIREEGRDWRSLGNLGIHLSVELSGDEDQWLDMEALLEEELDISEGIAGGEEENALVEPDAVAEDGSGILRSRLESSLDGEGRGASHRTSFAGHIVLQGELYAYGLRGVLRWTGLRWELISSRATSRLFAAENALVRLGEGEAEAVADGGTWTRLQVPKAVSEASVVLDIPRGLVTLRDGQITGWSADFKLAEPYPEFGGSTCLVAGPERVAWVCHSGSLWPLDASSDPVPLPRGAHDSQDLKVSGAASGRWVAWDDGAVWSYIDNKWVAFGRPGESDVVSVAIWGADIWVADQEGLWSIELQSADLERSPTSGVPPLDLLLRAAMKRADVAARAPSALKAMWLPRVELEGTFKPSDRLTYMPDTGSAGADDRSWGVMARLTWTPPGRTASLPWDGDDTATTGERLLFPSGEQGMLLLDQSALPRAVGATRRSSRVRGEEIASRVADLYAQRLGYERDTVYRDVSEAVIAMLEKQTVDALLDVYTEGAYSAWEGEEK